MQAVRVVDVGDRNAVLLVGDRVRVVVTDKGGMVPELSFPYANGWFNAHWAPPFRSRSGIPYSAKVHGDTWPVELLYDLAGNFPCLPNFGGPCTAYEVEMLPHGLTANGRWRHQDCGTIENFAYSISTIEPDESYPSIPLDYTKYDLVFADIPAHYVLIRVRNDTDSSYRVNLGWHNTIGPPFLSPGSLIDLSADRYATTPGPSEFDDTGRLNPGTEFDSIEHAPLATGGEVDLRRVPGMIGYTDFVTGAVPTEAELGWSSVVNPTIGALYLSVFPGPAAAKTGEIPINFNDLWMQYGGRRFPPWAATVDGTDTTYCLGVENAIGAYANGLEYSLDHPTLFGRPTTAVIEPNNSVDNVYATIALPYDGGSLDRGIAAIHQRDGGIDVEPRGGGHAISLSSDPSFDLLRLTVRRLEQELSRRGVEQ